MGGSESTRRRASSTGSNPDGWIPTLRFRKSMKGPNIQQDEEVTWVFQIWKDDSFMFRQTTTVKVARDFRSQSQLHREIVLQITHFGSGGRVVVTDRNACGVDPSSKIGSAFDRLSKLIQTDKKSKSKASDLDKPFNLLLRTQRVEFMKRHQRPAHIPLGLPEPKERARKSSVIVPDSHGLVNTAILLDPSELAKLNLASSSSAPPSIRVPKPKARPGLQSLHINPDHTDQKSPPSHAHVAATVGRAATATSTRPALDFKDDDSTSPAILTPDLDQPFDWEWECDGTIEEGPSFVNTVQTFFPPRIVDLIVGYGAPEQHKIESAAPPQSPLSLLFPPRGRGATIAQSQSNGAAATGSPPSPLTPAMPVFSAQQQARSTSVFGTLRKKNHSDADFLATPGCLRIMAEVLPRTESVKISMLGIGIMPSTAQDGKVDPDVDVNINFIKEPSPEPVALPRFELEPIEELVLDKVNEQPSKK